MSAAETKRLADIQAAEDKLRREHAEKEASEKRRIEAEAKEAEELFLETLSTWSIMSNGHLKERGMTRIEVVWEEKMTRTRFRNDKRADRGEEQPLLLV